VLSSENPVNRIKFHGKILVEHYISNKERRAALIDFLTLFLWTHLKPKRRQFILSAAQKKYQTLGPQYPIFYIKLRQHEFYKMFDKLQRKVISNKFIKPIFEDAVFPQHGKFVYILRDVPFQFYNGSLAYREVFEQQINDLTLKFYFKFDRQFILQNIFYFQFFRFFIFETRWS
jgi:hypothetical protein